MINGTGGSCRIIPAFGNLDAVDPAAVDGGNTVFEMPCMNGTRFMQPYYQLYDLADAPCDTLGIDGVTEGWGPPDTSVPTRSARDQDDSPRLYPNPASTHLIVDDLPEGGATLTVLDARGSRVREANVTSRTFTFDNLGDLPAGAYVVRARGLVRGEVWAMRFLRK